MSIQIQEDNASAFLRPQAATQSMILCCMCGTPVAPNTANMCPNCLATKVDITEGISGQLIVHHCRVASLPTAAMDAGETRIKGADGTSSPQDSWLKKVKLIDANFIWTEPHSKRIGKTQGSEGTACQVVLQQEFVVEYVV